MITPNPEMRSAAIAYRRTLLNLIDRLERDWGLGKYEQMPVEATPNPQDLSIPQDIPVASDENEVAHLDTPQKQTYNVIE